MNKLHQTTFVFKVESRVTRRREEIAVKHRTVKRKYREALREEYAMMRGHVYLSLKVEHGEVKSLSVPQNSGFRI